MSANLELRWLKIDELTGAAKRFAEFSKEDIKEQGNEENFDIKKYEAGVKLVLGKLDNSLMLKKLFNPALGEEAKSADTTLEKDEQAIDAVDLETVTSENQIIGKQDTEKQTKDNEQEETSNAN